MHKKHPRWARLEGERAGLPKPVRDMSDAFHGYCRIPNPTGQFTQNLSHPLDLPLEGVFYMHSVYQADCLDGRSRVDNTLIYTIYSVNWVQKSRLYLLLGDGLFAEMSGATLLFVFLRLFIKPTLGLLLT